MSHTPRPIRGPQRVHPGNPRYFTDDSGEAVYLTGSHTWANLHPEFCVYPCPSVANTFAWRHP